MIEHYDYELNNSDKVKPIAIVCTDNCKIVIIQNDPPPIAICTHLHSR